MLALIWVILLFATGSMQRNNKTCDRKTSTLTLKPTNLTAAAGRCVVLECSSENDVTSFAWYKNNQFGEGKTLIFNSSSNTTAHSRPVYLLEPDQKKKNCSIIIKNLTTSDTGVYYVRAEAANGCTNFSEANITLEVQEINITLEMAPLKNKSNITFTCSVPAFGSESKPQFTWIYQEAAGKDNITITNNNTEFMITMMKSHKSSLTFKTSAKHHNMKVTCRVNFTCNTVLEKTLDINQNLNIFSHLVELLKAKMIPVLIVFGFGFLIGSLVTTLIACLATKCCRNKKKSPHSTDELELVNSDAAFKDWDNEVPHVENNGILDVQDDGTLVFQDDGIQNQAAAECGEEICGDMIDLDMSPKESVYSDIDFSALKEKNPADAKKKEDTTETEYAEIKRGEMEEAQENEEMDCEISEGNDEMEVMIEHQEEAKQIVVAEEVIGEGDQLYYNNKEVMDEN